MSTIRPADRAKRASVIPRASVSLVQKYDAAYTAKKDYVARPNAFLDECLRRIAPKRTSRRKRRALDIGLGQGRNAMLLAKRGYLTTGIDRSEVGVSAARRLAAARGLRISAIVADAQQHDFGCNRWDLIVLLYYPNPMILMRRLKDAVRPGGYIVVERFSRPKAANVHDRRETKRASPMLRCFLDWRVLHYENNEFESDWHWNGKSPTGAIVRLLARKPSQR